jgi:hypothetical protein
MTPRLAGEPVPEPGDIWEEIDPRYNPPRYVLVVMTYPDYAKIIRVHLTGETFPKARLLDAKLGRFNGKRGGYKFVRAV